MNKKTAGERKRTVTVTIGPNTWELLEGYMMALSKATDSRPWNMTDIVTLLLRRGISSHPVLSPDGKGMPWRSERL